VTHVAILVELKDSDPCLRVYLVGLKDSLHLMLTLVVTCLT
jgi:hypothetical protein